MNSPLPESFGRLLAEFCQSVGLAMAEDASALEFSADGHTVVVGPDPRHPERLLIRVETGRDEPWPPGLALLLHQVNDAAVTAHDWIISLGATHELRLHTQVMLAQTTAADLEGLLADGVERAQALTEMVNTLSRTDDETADPGEQRELSPGAMGMLRA